MTTNQMQSSSLALQRCEGSRRSQRFLLPLLMAIVMMAMSPTMAWASPEEIMYNLTGCTSDASNPSCLEGVQSVDLKFCPEDGYSFWGATVTLEIAGTTIKDGDSHPYDEEAIYHINTNYMNNDGTITISCSKDLSSFTINIEAKKLPVLSVGSNTIEIEGDGDKEYYFKAPETKWYNFEVTGGEDIGIDVHSDVFVQNEIAIGNPTLKLCATEGMSYYVWVYNNDEKTATELKVTETTAPDYTLIETTGDITIDNMSPGGEIYMFKAPDSKKYNFSISDESATIHLFSEDPTNGHASMLKMGENFEYECLKDALYYIEISKSDLSPLTNLTFSISDVTPTEPSTTTIEGETYYVVSAPAHYNWLKAQAADNSNSSSTFNVLLAADFNYKDDSTKKLEFCAGTWNIDLNGHSITVQQIALAVAGADVTINDNSTTKTGKIVGRDYAQAVGKGVSYANGKLLINGGTFIGGTRYTGLGIYGGLVINGDYQNVTLHGGTYNVIHADGYGNLKKINMNGYAFYDANGDIVTIPTDHPGPTFNSCLSNVTVKCTHNYASANDSCSVCKELLPLCFTAEEAGSTVAIGKAGEPIDVTFEYKTIIDGTESDWTTYSDYATMGWEGNVTTAATNPISLPGVGDKVYFRNSSKTTKLNAAEKYYQFVMKGKIAGSGNTMSLMDKNCSTSTDFDANDGNSAFEELFLNCASLTKAPKLPAKTMAQMCYFNMFGGCTSLETAPALPADSLAISCYYRMFYGCTSLKTAPALSAKKIAESCYSSMFYGCTSLETAPALPADSLADSCYDNMFNGCTSLKTAPALPAEKIADLCYYKMFCGCTSLETAPALPAENLANGCYNNMFGGCTALKNAPTLPGENLPDYCYGDMFQGCTNLKSITVGFTDWSGDQNATSYWMDGVSGTDFAFSCPSALSTSGEGVNIPEGANITYWDQVTLDENGMATFSTWKNISLPEEANAYKASIDGTTVKLTELTGIIPAGTGVLLKGGPWSTIDLTIETDEATADVSDNILVATTKADGILADKPDEGYIYTYSHGIFKSSKDSYTHNRAILCFSVDPWTETLSIEEDKPENSAIISIDEDNGCPTPILTFVGDWNTDEINAMIVSGEYDNCDYEPEKLGNIKLQGVTATNLGTITTPNPNTIIEISEDQTINNEANVLVNGNVANLVITDTETKPTVDCGFYYLGDEFTATKATYTRPMSSTYATLMIPFDFVPAEQSATIMDISSVSKDAIVVEPTKYESISFGRPVIAKVSGNELKITAENTSCAGTSGAIGNMSGVYEKATLTSCYYLDKDKVKKIPEEGVDILPFHCFFIFEEEGIELDDTLTITDTTAAIKTVHTADTNAPAYNIQGVRVSANAKGIVIKNGKKAVNK